MIVRTEKFSLEGDKGRVEIVLVKAIVEVNLNMMVIMGARIRVMTYRMIT